MQSWIVGMATIDFRPCSSIFTNKSGRDMSRYHIEINWLIVTGSEKRDHFVLNAIFCHFSNSPFQGLKSRRLLAWFISSLDLLLHRSNVRSLSKPPVLSGEPPKWGIKRRFSNAIDVRGRPTHTGSGRGPQLAPSVDGWLKNIHARFEVHSCYGSRDISVLKWKFGNSAKWSLFSDPVTIYEGYKIEILPASSQRTKPS